MSSNIPIQPGSQVTWWTSGQGNGRDGQGLDGLGRPMPTQASATPAKDTKASKPTQAMNKMFNALAKATRKRHGLPLSSRPCEGPDEAGPDETAVTTTGGTASLPMSPTEVNPASQLKKSDNWVTAREAERVYGLSPGALEGLHWHMQQQMSQDSDMLTCVKCYRKEDVEALAKDKDVGQDKKKAGGLAMWRGSAKGLLSK